ncbi:MAG: hypothetical protein R3E66_12185 [bacterium]
MNLCRITALLVALLTSAAASDAAAAEGRLRLAPTFADLNGLGAEGLWGLGGQAGFEWGFADYWAAVVDATGSYHFADDEREIPAQLVTAVALGLRYNIDIFTYVPWISVSGVSYFNQPLVEGLESNVNAGARVGFGVDYRMDRDFAVGVFGELHAPFSDIQNYPIYSNVGINVAWIFRL